jgi:uncharacterized protein
MFYVRSSRSGTDLWAIRLLALPALALACLMPSVAWSQSAPPGSATPGGPYHFVYLRGADTLGTETVTLGARAASGVLNLRGQPRMEWSHAVADSGARLGPLTVSVFAPDSPTGSPAMQRVVFTQIADSMVMQATTSSGELQRKARATRAGVTPFLGQSVVHATFITALARRLKLSTLPVFEVLGFQTFDMAVVGEGISTTSSVAGLAIVTLWQNGSPQEISVAAQRLRVVRTESAPSVALPPATPSYAAPADAPYTAEDVTIPTPRGYTLAGTLTRPRGARGPVPVVVTISGSGPQERDARSSTVPGYAPFREFADTLGRRGIAVLRYDDRGVGASGGARSAASATSADLADDVASVVAYLRTRNDVDARRIALAGHSEGGIIAPMVAARDSGVAAVILIAAPAERGRDIAMKQIRIMLDAESRLTPAQRDSIIATVPGIQNESARTADPWSRFWLTYDPSPTLRSVKQPVLILQGATDSQVPVNQAAMLERALKEAGNSSVTVKVFPDVNHLMVHDTSGLVLNYGKLTDVTVRRDVRGALADWLMQTLRP